MSGRPASGHVPVRGGSHLRRGQNVRRASARFSLTRVGAVAVLLAVSLALFALTGPSAFAARSVEVDGVRLTGQGDVSEALAEGGLGNLFRYDTAAAALRVGRLPAVLHAEVSAVLPDRVVARVEERTAVLRWTVGDATFLADDQGLLFASDEDGAGPIAGGDTVATVADRRAASVGLAIGSRLNAVDVRVARQLGALTPAMVRSTAPALAVVVDDQQGFTLTAGWVAVFGVYGEVTRSPDLVPLQVQCLASLLADRGEAAVSHVVLSPEGQLCGTYGAP
jgi:hypothetical protein